MPLPRLCMQALGQTGLALLDPVGVTTRAEDARARKS